MCMYGVLTLNLNMAMYYRSKMTGESISVPYADVFKNTSPKDCHTRMLTFDLGIPDESYIVTNRVKVNHVCGTYNLAKICVGNIDNDTWNIMKAFHSCISRMYPDMSIDPLDRRSLKLVLKKKWYRVYDKNGDMINPPELLIDSMKERENKYGFMSFQIHVNVIRTHKNRILFQPMIRKVFLN
jgi:hypothetical protein